MLERSSPAVRWAVLRKPKSDASYDLPILEGVGPVTFEPVGAGIAEAYGVLEGDREDDTWRLMYESMMGRAGRNGSFRPRSQAQRRRPDAGEVASAPG